MTSLERQRLEIAKRCYEIYKSPNHPKLFIKDGKIVAEDETKKDPINSRFDIMDL